MIHINYPENMLVPPEVLPTFFSSENKTLSYRKVFYFFSVIEVKNSKNKLGPRKKNS